MADDEVNIDLSNYKDRVGERVTPGRYRVLVEDAEVSKAGSGNTMVTLFLRVIDNPEFDGANIVDRLVQHENSMFRTVNFMQALGLPTPRKRLRIKLSQFVGKVLDVDVDDGDPYNGRVKSEVRGYLRATPRGQGGEEATTLPADLDEAMSEFTSGTGVPPAAENAGESAEPTARTDAGGSQAPDAGEGEKKPEGDEFTSSQDGPDEVDLDKLDLG